MLLIRLSLSAGHLLSHELLHSWEMTPSLSHHPVFSLLQDTQMLTRSYPIVYVCKYQSANSFSTDAHVKSAAVMHQRASMCAVYSHGSLFGYLGLQAVS